MKKVTVLGGGPAGLYAAYLLKKQFPGANVEVFERNSPNVTFGFGVVFSAEGLKGLAGNDSDIIEEIAAHSQQWDDMEINIHGQKIVIDGVSFSAIGRLQLLSLLHRQAEHAGAILHYDRLISDPSELEGSDLVIAADGANSLIRTHYAEQFGTTSCESSNRFAWFGATRPFDRLTQTFKRNEDGFFNAHHYRFAPDRSTFLVETDAQTFQSHHMEELDEEESRRVCEDVFADVLDGASLIANKSIWRRFPKISNARWYHRNIVLIGDALRTAHFSIGSGTRLALEDAQELVSCLVRNPDNVKEAFETYETLRRPKVEKFVAAANRSADWYDDFPRHMQEKSWEFAMAYIGRTGRIDPDRLLAMSPQFVKNFERANDVEWSVN